MFEPGLYVRPSSDDPRCFVIANSLTGEGYCGFPGEDVYQYFLNSEPEPVGYSSFERAYFFLPQEH